MEANPLMAPLSGIRPRFRAGEGAADRRRRRLLTQLARIRAFGSIPVGFFLYLVLAIYGA